MFLRSLASLRGAATVTALLTTSILAAPAVPASAENDQPDTLAGALAVPPCRVNRWLPGSLRSATDRDWFSFRLTSPSTVLLTLGDLPADHRLTLVNATGRQLAASDNTGTTFEQIHTRLDAGRYFIEVSPGRGEVEPQRGYRLLIRPVPNRVMVLDAHTGQQDRLFTVTGQLLNNTGSWRRYPKVTARFFGAGGGYLGQSTALAEQTYLAPGQRGHFRIVVDAPAGMVRYTLSVRAPRTAPPARPALSLQADEPYPVGGNTRYVGRVASGGTTTGSVHVHVLRYNRIGAFVDYGHEVLARVAPGEPARYELELPTLGYISSVRLAYSLG